jgi:hypothetical protein
MNPRQRQAKYAAEHRHWRDRLLAVHSASSPDVLEAGRLWYPDAEAIIAALAERYAQPRPQVAGIVAALSPQQRWRKNVESAISILEGRGSVAGYAANREKARRIVEGEYAWHVLGGDKVCAFWANLIGSRYAVTIDTWAQRGAIGRMTEQPKNARYERIARAYRAAAYIVGETPREFQAQVWLAVRPQSEHREDTATIERMLG